MTLQEARDLWHQYKQIGNTVYYVPTKNRGYNQTSYRAMRMFGPAPTEEEFINGFDGSPYCGGVSYEGGKRSQAEFEFGEMFSFTIWGCD